MLIPRTSRRWGSTLVYLEHAQGKLVPSVLNTLAASRQLDQERMGVLITHSKDQVSFLKDQWKHLEGLTRVIHYSSPDLEHELPERIAPILKHCIEKWHITHFMVSSQANGKNLAPRLAALMDVAPISDVTGIETADTFVRPIYAGNAICRVKSTDPIKIMTIRSTAFSPTPVKGEGPQEIPIEEATPEAPSGELRVQWIEDRENKMDRPSLDSSRVVISGGRGLKSADNFKLLYDLASKLGAAGKADERVDNLSMSVMI